MQPKKPSTWQPWQHQATDYGKKPEAPKVLDPRGDEVKGEKDG